MKPLRVIVEGVAFLLEMAALAALGAWGASLATGVAASVGLAVFFVGAAAVVWGLFAAPRARVTLPVAGILLTKLLVFGAATAGAYHVAGIVAAAGFAVVAVVDTALLTWMRRRG